MSSTARRTGDRWRRQRRTRGNAAAGQSQRSASEQRQCASPRLSPDAGRGTSLAVNVSPPHIFDRNARRLRRDRIARRGGSPLEAGIARELLDRLDLVTRSFARALIVNTGTRLLADGLKDRGLAVDETDHGAVYADVAHALWCDEDRLRVTPKHYDLVIMPGGLDTIDDVPGALIAARMALQPGGLFLGCLVGAPSLPTLRHVAMNVDAAQERAVARFHPQIDVRAAGDLLARAGFVLPVADAETLSLSYPSLGKLLHDMRDAGLTSLLAERHALNRQWLGTANDLFAGMSNDQGRVHETATLLFLAGWVSEQPIRT